MPSIYLHRLAPEVSGPLTAVLLSSGCNVVRRWPDEALPMEAEMVFCSCEAGILQEALHLSHGRPVVVASRLPDVSGWLDALEMGAADYIAAPFEPVQIGWLFRCHADAPQEMASAAAA